MCHVGARPRRGPAARTAECAPRSWVAARGVGGAGIGLTHDRESDFGPPRASGLQIAVLPCVLFILIGEWRI